jgi:hypothetical protein
MLRSFRMIGGAALVFLLLGMSSAEAHSDLRMGAFAGGLIHPFETFPQLLLLVSLGLRIGQFPPFRLPFFLAWFAPSAAAALIFTAFDSGISVPVPLLVLLAFGIGVLISSNRPALGWMNGPLLAVVAMAVGLDSAVVNPSSMVVAKVLFANWVCLLVLVGYLAFYTSLLPLQKWGQTAVRILGSWIIAISGIMLAFEWTSAR